MTQGVGVATATADNGAMGTYLESWSFDMDTTPYIIDDTQSNQGLVDAFCSSDYVDISSSYSGACGAFIGERSVNTRYCGARLGATFFAAATTTQHLPVCDCSE